MDILEESFTFKPQRTTKQAPLFVCSKMQFISVDGLRECVLIREVRTSMLLELC